MPSIPKDFFDFIDFTIFATLPAETPVKEKLFPGVVDGPASASVCSCDFVAAGCSPASLASR